MEVHGRQGRRPAEDTSQTRVPEDFEDQEVEEDSKQWLGGKKPAKRANKNRPAEMSSKRPVPRFREVVQPTKKELRDPRFETLSGKFNETGFRKAYGFLYEEVLPAEKESLKEELTNAKLQGGHAKELEDNFSRVDRLLKEDQKNQAKRDREREIRKTQMDRLKHGKKPFFLKKSEEKKIELMGKFEELKGKGKLDVYMTKKRKKNAAKDRRFMPYRRPDQNERKR